MPPQRKPMNVKMNLILASLFILLITLTGCQLKEEQLQAWQVEEGGHLKIASYVLDTSRPTPLRKKGLLMLAEGRHYDDILSLFDLTLKLEQDAVEQASFIAEQLTNYLGDRLAGNPSAEKALAAAELGFYLMSQEVGREKVVQREDIIKALTLWSIEYLRSERKLVVPYMSAGSSKKKAQIKEEELLTALLFTAGLDQEKNIVFELLQKDLNEHLGKLQYIINAHKITHQTRNPYFTQEMAALLLKASKRAYERDPREINEDLLDAMLANRNTTLLRFMIELGRDRKISSKLLLQMLNAAMKAAVDRGVEGEMVPVLRRVMQSSSAHSTSVFFSLELAWKVTLEEGLRENLMSITPDFNAPVSGTELKKEVDHFCEDVVGDRYKDSVREIFLNLLEELKDKPAQWPARLITVSCVYHLYPDDFPALMRRGRLFKRYYKRDNKRVAAWRGDGSVSLSSIYTEYLNPKRGSH